MRGDPWRLSIWRWIHPEKHRYYQAALGQDLFGDWVVITAWGGLGSRRGRQRKLCVRSYEAGVQQLAAIDKRRLLRGYWSTGEGVPSPCNTGSPLG